MNSKHYYRIKHTIYRNILQLFIALALMIFMPGVLYADDRLQTKQLNEEKQKPVSHDIVGINLGMPINQLRKLLNTKMEVGKPQGIVFDYKEDKDNPCRLITFNATSADNKAETNLSIIFTSDKYAKVQVAKITRNDKMQLIEAAVFRKSFVQKYGAPTYIADTGNLLIWSERIADECHEHKYASKKSKGNIAVKCGKRLILSFSPKDSISSFDMVLEDNSEQQCPSM